MTKKKAKQVMGAKVTKVAEVKRPLKGWPGKIGIPHTAVVVTTKHGKYLIEKQKTGIFKGKVRVVPWNKVKNKAKWKVIKSKTQKKPTTVEGIAKASNKGYFVVGNNCWTSSDKMYQKGKRNMCKG